MTVWLDALMLNDCEADEHLDRITQDAALLFKAPIAMINLVTPEHVIFKACVGFEQGDKVDQDGSFCAKASKQEAPLMIVDARLDDQFKDYVMVTGSDKIRSYFGKSLHAPDGAQVGTLCLFDTKPRTYTAEQHELLCNLAEMANEHIAAIIEEYKALPDLSVQTG